MFKYFVLFSLISLFNAEVVVTDVSEHCTWGPSFWCSGIKAAKDCGAVHFCIRNTWRQSSFVEGIHDDDTCTFCQKLVTDIKDYVTADQTEKAIIAYADKACTQLPDKFIADECKGIANMYIVQIISMLRQNMDAKAVCHAINLCAGADMFFSQPRYRPYFAVSQTTVTKMAADKLKTADVDDHFKNMASNTAAGKYLPSQSRLTMFRGTTADQCSTCKEGVADLKVVFSNAQARGEVEQILKSNICPRFILPSECDKLIDDYAPEIFQVISTLDPTAACEIIGLCDVDEANKQEIKLTLEKPISITSPVKASVQCILCEYVMSMIIQSLNNKHTDEEVIQTVEHICDILPKTVKSECDQFIVTYGQEVIDLLTHSTDPQSVCSLIHLCATYENSNIDINLNEFVEPFVNNDPGINGFENPEQKKPLMEDKECMMCRIVTNYLISMLSENYTTEAVEAALDKVCNVLPSSYSSECRQFVAEYAPQIVNSLMSDLNTETICEDIHLCKPTYFSDKENAEKPIISPVLN